MSHQIGPSKRLRQKYLICIQFLGRVQPLTDEEELKQRRKDLPLLDGKARFYQNSSCHILTLGLYRFDGQLVGFLNIV